MFTLEILAKVKTLLRFKDKLVSLGQWSFTFKYKLAMLVMKYEWLVNFLTMFFNYRHTVKILLIFFCLIHNLGPHSWTLSQVTTAAPSTSANDAAKLNSISLFHLLQIGNYNNCNKHLLP